MSSPITPLAAAQGYVGTGLSVFPIAADGTKSPFSALLPKVYDDNDSKFKPSWKPFQDRMPTADELSRWYSGEDPIGIALVAGKGSGNLEIIDVDEPGLDELFIAELRLRDAALADKLTWHKTPRPGGHFLYRCETVQGNQVLARYLVDGKPKARIETRGQGGYVLMPGSAAACHDSGRQYVHHAGPLVTDVQTITPAERALLFSVARSFNLLVGNDELPPEQRPTRSATMTDIKPGDDYNARATWDEILSGTGWTNIGTVGGLDRWRRPGKESGWSATTGCKSESGAELFYCFSSSAHPFEGARADGKAGTAYSKFACYTLLRHGGDYSAAAKALYDAGYGTRHNVHKTSTAAPPEKFVPFPINALPVPLCGFVTAGAKAIGCDASYLALPLLTALAAAIGNTRRIQLKRGWSAPAIIWSAIVGESGTAKTPAFKLVMRPVRKRQQKALEHHAEAERQFEVSMAHYEKALAEWNRDKKTIAPPPTKPELPQAERFIVSDTTVEALAPLLLVNSRGLLMARDELSGWIGSFDRYSGGKGGADSSHWLSMHNGESILVDRKTGIPRTIYVPQASVSVCGGIQPGILHRALGMEHRESGLAARLLLSCPPRIAKRWTEADIDPTAEADITRLVDRLFTLEQEVDPESPADAPEYIPVVVGLTTEAKTAWRSYYDAHAQEQADLSGDLSAAWSKLEEYAARLALVIHFVRWAADDPTLASVNTVDVESMSAGISLTTWFKGEARRVYAMLGESDDDRDRRRLTEWIGRKGGSVTAREVQQGCRWITSSDDAEAALVELVNAGYGEWEPSPAGKRGQPTRRFRLSTPSTVYGNALFPSEYGDTVGVDTVDEPETKTVDDINGELLAVANDEWGEL